MHNWLPHRRRLVICGSAALTFFVIEFAVRRHQQALCAYDVGLYRRAQVGLQNANHPEVVLVGSSRVLYGLDPTIFEQTLGCTAYNAGLSGSRAAEWSVFVKRLLKDIRPRLLILGINADELRADYVPTEGARNLFDFDNLVESLRVEGFSLDVNGAYLRRALGPLWKTFHFRYELRNWGQEQLACIFPKHAQLARELRERAAQPPPPKGYDHPWSHGRRLKNLMQMVMDDHLEVLEEKALQHRDDAASFVRLEMLLDWLRQRDIRVLVAYLPNSPRTEERWRDVEPLIKAQIAKICNQRGVPFCNWEQSQLPRGDQDYIHETHVGWPLAKEISRRIAEQVRGLALLNDTNRPVDSQVAGTEANP